MTKEQCFFLQVLSDHLNGRKTQAHEGMDWSDLLTFARIHQVSGIVYHQCKDFLPPEPLRILTGANASELFYYSNRASLFRHISEAFSAADIPFFCVKGFVVAQHYPIPPLRTMGDCDIVVRPEDKERAHTQMIKLGFDCGKRESVEWQYFKKGIEFELHDRLFYDQIMNSESNQSFSEAAWSYAKAADNGACFQLDWSYHFVFLLLHLKKHMLSSGVGFRQFMDLAVVIRNCQLDWRWIEQELNDQNLFRFAQVCFSLLYHWFDTPQPVCKAVLDEAFLNEATNKIFGNGVFGFQDSDNKENAALAEITQRKGPRWWRRVSSMLKIAFPSYEHMYYVSEYAFLNNRPWLLPVAWLYRFYRSVRYRMGENGKRMVNNALISDDRLDEREQELAKWGLSKP